jgi:hypothetical protein
VPVETRYEDSVTLALDLEKRLERALRPDVQHVQPRSGERVPKDRKTNGVRIASDPPDCYDTPSVRSHYTVPGLHNGRV